MGLQPRMIIGASLSIGAAACRDPAPAPLQNQPPVAVAGGHYAGQDTIHFDGSTDTGATPAHLYTRDGGYRVTLTVTDARGASGPAASTAAHVQASPLVL